MNSADLSGLQETLADLYSLYGKALTSGAVNWWARALRSYSLSQVRAALLNYSKGGKYLPKPADIVEALRQPAIGGSSAPQQIQCCFEADGQRCPLVGHYDLMEGHFDGQRLCPEHNNLRGMRRDCVEYMQMALDHRLPKFEHANDRVMREFMEIRPPAKAGSAKHIVAEVKGALKA